jgi:HEAT repeat protein
VKREEEARPHLERALLDPNAAVRYLARASLRSLGAVGSREAHLHALGALADAASIVGALGGLADLGTREDAAVAAAFLRDPRVRVRAEACRTVGVLDPEGFRDALVAMRGDPSPRVVREAECAGVHG